jgi:putative membrane protein
MKAHQRLKTVTAAAVAALAFAAGCSTQNQTTASLGAAPASPAAAAAFNATDRALALQMAGDGMYEVEAGRLAAARARNAAVQSYGQMLVSHHGAANMELATLMRARGLVPPTALPADKQAKLSQLAALSGDAFDRQFIQVAGVQDHTAGIALFERGARDAADPAFKAWITKTLPTLRAHLQQAQTIAGTLGG